jgi:hypothetical protein
MGGSHWRLVKVLIRSRLRVICPSLLFHMTEDMRALGIKFKHDTWNQLYNK